MKNQEKIWNNLAEQWDNFRNKPEKIVYYFKEKYNKTPIRIIDIGCGNCRNLIPFQKDDCYGVDFSKKMLEKAKLISKKHKLNLKLYKAELTKLPFKNNFFDRALMLASLHHIENNKDRIKALEELHRILKKDGIALITVWNKWQLRFLFNQKNTYIKWKIKEKIYDRYYYLFNYFELKNLIKKPNFKILESKSFGKNIIFIVKK